LVDERRSEVAGSGQSLSYTIEFRNSGAVPARHVIVTDDLPASLVYEPNSLHFGDRALTDQADADAGEVAGQTIKVKLDEVRPNELVQISFRARAWWALFPQVLGLSIPPALAATTPRPQAQLQRLPWSILLAECTRDEAAVRS